MESLKTELFHMDEAEINKLEAKTEMREEELKIPLTDDVIEAVKITRALCYDKRLILRTTISLHGVELIERKTLRSMMQIIHPAQIVIKPYGWDMWFPMDGYSIVGRFKVRECVVVFFCSQRKSSQMYSSPRSLRSNPDTNEITFSTNARIVTELITDESTLVFMERMYRYAEGIGSLDNEFVRDSTLPQTLKDAAMLTITRKCNSIFLAVNLLLELKQKLSYKQWIAISCSLLREAADMEYFDDKYLEGILQVHFPSQNDFSEYM